MLKKKTAYEIYTTESLNCAQSILKGYQEEFEISDEKIKEFKAFGGGRAEGNMCGALYAASSLIQDDNIRENLISDFAEQTGSTCCRVIRKANKISCKECVRIASELLDNTLQNA